MPGAGNLVASLADTGYADVGPSGGYYKLSAVDFNGNESAFALVGPGQTLDAPLNAEAGVRARRRAARIPRAAIA